MPTIVQSFDLFIPFRSEFQLDAKVLTEALAALGLDVWMPPNARLATADVDYVPVQVRLPLGVINTGFTLSAPEDKDADGTQEDADQESEEYEESGEGEDEEASEDEEEEAEEEEEEETAEDEEEEEEEEEEDEEEEAAEDEDENEDEESASDEDEDGDDEPAWLDGEIGHYTLFAKNAPIPADENEVPLAWFIACALARLGNGAVVDPQSAGEPLAPEALAEHLRQQKMLFDYRRSAWTVYPYDLFNALSEGDSEGALREIRRGAPLDCRDSHGNTPLQLAFANGLPELGRLLLRWGADLHAVNRYGRTTLEAALVSLDSELARDLLGHGAVVGDLPFRQAARDESSPRLATLLDAGFPLHSVSPDGWTLLATAAWHGSAQNVRLLLDRGADPRAAAPAGQTPLALARQGNHTEIIELLQARGAFY